MLMYRIQRENGAGPYVGRPSTWSVKCNNAENGRPEPEQDGMGFVSYRCVYGFSSLEQLFKWFNEPEEHRRLTSMGYSIYVFELDTEQDLITFGGKQMAAAINTTLYKTRMDLREEFRKYIVDNCIQGDNADGDTARASGTGDDKQRGRSISSQFGEGAGTPEKCGQETE